MALAPNLWWLFVGRVLSGTTTASYSTAYAYLADATPPDQRAGVFGLVGAAFGVGFVLGPALGGLLGAVEPRLPFWVAAGLSLANALYGYCVLPESLPPDRRMAFSLARANPVGSLRLLARHRELLGMAGVFFLYQLAHVALPSVAVLYATYRYGWSATTMGLTLAAVGVATIVVNGALVKPTINRIGLRATLLLGLLCGAGGFAIYAFARTGPAFWAGIPVLALWGLSASAALGMMSGLVGPSEQGQLQGANSSLTAIAELVGPGIFTLIFAWAIPRGIPGTPFLLAAGLLIVATALGFVVTRPRPGLSPGAPL